MSVVPLTKQLYHWTLNIAYLRATGLVLCQAHLSDDEFVVLVFDSSPEGQRLEVISEVVHKERVRRQQFSLEAHCQKLFGLGLR